MNGGLTENWITYSIKNRIKSVREDMFNYKEEMNANEDRDNKAYEYNKKMYYYTKGIILGLEISLEKIAESFDKHAK